MNANASGSVRASGEKILALFHNGITKGYSVRLAYYLTRMFGKV